jgi:hypothetical protein
MRGETDRRAGWIRFPKQPIPPLPEAFSTVVDTHAKGARYYKYEDSRRRAQHSTEPEPPQSRAKLR